MKKIFLLLLTFLVLGAGTTQAQDTKAIKKLIKTSSKSLKKYVLDSSKTDKLDAAKKAIEEVLKLDGAADMPKVWIAKANIYKAVAQKDIIGHNEVLKQEVLGGEVTPYKVKSPEAAVQAFEAFEKALSLSEKKNSKVVKELEGLNILLDNIARLLYQNNKDYANAYKNFLALTKSNDLVKMNGGKALLDTAEKIDETSFFAAFCAQKAELKAESLAIYEDMYKKGSKRIDVYDALFKANLEKDEELALKYLGEGRAIDPENINLLFSEINFYLKKGQYDILEGKLKEAMAKEPNNAGLRTVMGNVYNDFYKKEKDATKAKGFFNTSEDYYKQALEIDDQSFEALYSLGELNYNRAAALVTKYNDLPITASQRDANALKSDYLAAFDKALPFFLKADDVNNKDFNTILALKEIYAKKNDFTKSNEYKDRLNALKLK